MADNPPAPNPGPKPTLPASMTGRPKTPPTQLPVRKGGAGKIVVMLSSVAKPPPAVTQALPQVAPSAADSTAISAPPASTTGNRPPPLPPTQVSPAAGPEPSRSQMSTTTHVKLPPKTTVPGLSSLSGKPLVVPNENMASQATSSPQVLKVPEPIRIEPKKAGAQHIPPIKLNEPSLPDDLSGESIFLPKDQSAPVANSEAGKTPDASEAKLPAGEPQSLDAFERSQTKPGVAVPSPAPVIEAKDQSAPLVVPPSLPSQRLIVPESSGASPSSRPPPLPPPLPKSVETVSPPTPILHVAPPMLEKAPEMIHEKLPPPNLPLESREEAPPVLPESAPVQKAPALIQPEIFSVKPLLPPTLPAAKTINNWLKRATPHKKTTPIVVSSSSPKTPVPTIVEAKPALKPAVLPNRSLHPEKPFEKLSEGQVVAPPLVEAPKISEPAQTPEKLDPPVSLAEGIPALVAVPLSAVEAAMQPTVASSTVPPPGEKTPVPEEKQKTAAKFEPVKPAPSVPVVPLVQKEKKPVPLTRAERAKKRRFTEMILFWGVIFPATIILLFLGSLHFGRDTRVEGQVIPPPGTALYHEMWIVTDFSSLASGIAEDLAAERTPILQEIQERQEHVQRAQADVAAREERIRLITQEIQSTKGEIESIVKQSRDATQQVWDVDGAAIDDEYASRMQQLQNTIADRAKSLKLNYQPDPAFPSPEVWANAYRLALYEVPPGVDSVKEHAWLADQMKQWRDLEKSLDDRKEQLREKAAEIKLAPAPKIADFNSKIDDLQQRIDATEAEEVPLKAELEQAQVDLAAAQSAESGLDDKYYKQLDTLPAEAVTKHIPLRTNGRFTWVEDDVFVEGEKEHHYWLFARATRADGRQYWALQHFSISKNQTFEMSIEPSGFISTKAILRPDLSPEEQQQ